MTAPGREFVYLTSGQIAEINADQENGGTVRDGDALDRSVDRPKTELVDGGFLTVWEKAAAYAHGLARNHPFLEANKRTAWYAAVTFLRLNGIVFPEVPTIEAEIFIRAVAQEVFKTDEDPDLTLGRSAEWFEAKWRNQRVGHSTHPELEYVYLAGDVRGTEEIDAFQAKVLGPGTLTAMGAGMHRLVVRAEEPAKVFPIANTRFFVVGRWWRAPLHGTMTATVHQPAGAKPVRRNKAEMNLTAIQPITIETMLPEYAPYGQLPLLFWIELRPVFLDLGADPYQVVVDVNGEVIARIPLRVQLFGTVPEHL
ncbi:type II toxin-antitoxin system death-on-curing family toxin [Mycolicibacterium aichiense]|uniref:type II toxin-antitoxin system death-on-curing family toxin n=1 Tax=Mycolicibacterium aichiense TaxID=1799 RepID=UPI000E06E17C|nr:type II toxin-antitoxin system death-on-curing family toxin [Mycolicibacterium aichiense]MCV7017638.1 type II toxin-antitoxin system death-on-curing family toxin [Mycolicibacterium aichiense]STZ80575.1 death-on-curing family protein [Mycolicibacterium aichiense]